MHTHWRTQFLGYDGNCGMENVNKSRVLCYSATLFDTFGKVGQSSKPFQNKAKRNRRFDNDKNISWDILRPYVFFLHVVEWKKTIVSVNY